MLRKAIFLLITVSLFLMTSATLVAQSAVTPLSELYPRLYQQLIAAHDLIFSSLTSTEPEDIRKARQDKTFHINNLLADQLSSFPLGSSAGGFTWTFEPVSGTFTRASESFGPIFAERALTIGKEKLNAGINSQRVTFDHLDGKKLQGGEIVGYTGLPNYLGVNSVFFEDRLDLQLTTDTVSVFATYGLSDRLDVGVAVPINRVSVKASLVSRYGDSVTGTTSPANPHPLCASYYIPTIQERTLPPPVRADGCGVAAEASGTATGIGDIVVRAKYRLLKRQGGGLAGGADVRLPTGDERNLLGIAGGQAKVYVAASTEFGHVSPHVNFGYTVSGESDAAKVPNSFLIAPPDEVNYAGGADVPVSLRTTVAFDIVGRTLRKVGTLEQVPTLFGSRGGDPDRPINFYQEFALRPGDLHLLLGSPGIKVNPAANMLLSANVLFPLSQRGLTDNLTWLMGLDYSF